jgi:hypothetical protein
MYVKKNSQHDIAETLLKFTTFPFVTLSSGADPGAPAPGLPLQLEKNMIFGVKT